MLSIFFSTIFSSVSDTFAQTRSESGSDLPKKLDFFALFQIRVRNSIKYGSGGPIERVPDPDHGTRNIDKFIRSGGGRISPLLLVAESIKLSSAGLNFLIPQTNHTTPNNKEL